MIITATDIIKNDRRIKRNDYMKRYVRKYRGSKKVDPIDAYVREVVKSVEHIFPLEQVEA